MYEVWGGGTHMVMVVLVKVTVYSNMDVCRYSMFVFIFLYVLFINYLQLNSSSLLTTILCMYSYIFSVMIFFSYLDACVYSYIFHIIFLILVEEVEGERTEDAAGDYEF